MKINSLLLFLMLCASQVSANSKILVQYSGCLEEAQVVFNSSPTSLELLKFPKIQPCAYKFATALTQPHLVSVQKKQKESLLSHIQLLLLSSSSEPFKEYLVSLRELIQSQPITGRVLGVELDSTRVEIIPLQNRVWSKSLRLHFPKKLKSIYFIGANKTKMLYRPVLTLEDYLNRNPLLDFVEQGYVYVVQANGDIEKLKVGYWNHQKQYVSPGGWVVGLLKPSLIDEVAPTFNKDLSHWLATQVLP